VRGGEKPIHPVRRQRGKGAKNLVTERGPKWVLKGSEPEAGRTQNFLLRERDKGRKGKEEQTIKGATEKGKKSAMLQIRDVTRGRIQIARACRKEMSTGASGYEGRTGGRGGGKKRSRVLGALFPVRQTTLGK